MEKLLTVLAPDEVERFNWIVTGAIPDPIEFSALLSYLGEKSDPIELAVCHDLLTICANFLTDERKSCILQLIEYCKASLDVQNIETVRFLIGVARILRGLKCYSEAVIALENIGDTCNEECSRDILYELMILYRYLGNHKKAIAIARTFNPADFLSDDQLINCVSVFRESGDLAAARRFAANCLTQGERYDYELGAITFFDQWNMHYSTSMKPFLETEMSLQDSATVFSKLRAAIYSKQPYSFIRLGDGEGNILGYYLFPENIAIRKWAERIITMQLTGCDNELLRVIKDIAMLLKTAILGADGIGILPPTTITKCPWPADRQFAGNIVNYIFIHMVQSHLRSEFFCDSCISYDLSYTHALLGIVRQLNFLGVIGPHPDVLERIKANSSIAHGVFHRVPGESIYFKPDQRHYPDVFNNLCSEIKPPFTGAVYLIGAGLLGKYYCELVRERGGIAIDVGSLMDGIAGVYKTRAPLRRLGTDLSSKLGI